MKIITRANKIFIRMLTDPAYRHSQGETLQNLACEAMELGMTSQAWKDYMRLFSSNPEQFARLTGDEPDFESTTWGKKARAYLLSNGGCGSDTTGGTGPMANAPAEAFGSARFMNAEMIEILDLGVNSEDDPDFPDPSAVIEENA